MILQNSKYITTFLQPLNSKLQCDYSNQGTWKKIIQSQRFWKQNIIKVFLQMEN